MFLDNKFIKMSVTFYVLFICFCLVLIYKMSGVAIDGNRYFMLFDDAMISMTYANNLATGNGLTYNGVLVEGYTNLLWTLIMSVFIKIFGKTYSVLFIQLFGILVLITNSSMVYKIFKLIYGENEHWHSYKIFVIFTSLLYYPLVFWTLSGMETGIYSLLLSMLIYEVFKSKNLNLKIPFLAFALAITRLETLMLIFLILFYRLIQKDIKSANKIKESSLFIILLLSSFIWRFLYYGDFLPNTYYLKVYNISFSDRISNGLAYLIFFIAPFLVFFFIKTPLESVVKDKRKLLILASFLLNILYQIYVGGDAWPTQYRMTTPIFIIFFTMLVSEYLFCVDCSDNRRFTLAFLLILTFNLIYVRHWFLFMNLNTFNLQSMNKAVIYKDVLNKDATIAVLAGGVIPYFSELRTYDILGKSDKYISKLKAKKSEFVPFKCMNYTPGHNKYDLSYVISLKPDILETVKWGEDDVTEIAKNYYYEVKINDLRFFIKKDSEKIDMDKLIKKYKAEICFIDNAS